MEKKNNISIIIAGDLVPTKSNEKEFIDGNIESLFGKKILNDINKSDFFCFNMEAPLVRSESPIEKNGPCLSINEKTIVGIKKINPSLVFLANNHILDQGIDGLKNTKKILQENNINFIGIGNNELDARKWYICNFNKYKIGFYNCCAHEFSIARKSLSGANGYNPLFSYDDIKKMSNECDKVIVIYHGGKEHYRYPSPNLQEECRKFIDSGANLVVCQHSHCIGCEENYNNGVIVYGQGNFIFDDLNNEYWNNSLLIKFNINIVDGMQTVEYIPISKDGKFIRKSDFNSANEILKKFFERSNAIIENGFVEKKYRDYSSELYNNNVAVLTGRKFIYKILNKITFGIFYKKYYNKKNLLSILNYLECEDLRELLIESIKSKIDSD